jgi:antirestriction protein ArdC
VPAATAKRTVRRAASGDSDRLTALHDTLTDAVAALVSGEEWAAMLAAATRFHRYSLSNLLLIYRARPDAIRVAGFRTWLTLGRHVRKGERGIPILAPCTYKTKAATDDDGTGDPTGTDADGDGTPRRVLRGFRVVYVFDISQTEGDPVPEVVPVLLEGEDPGRLWDALAAQVSAAGFALDRADCSPANGITDYETRRVSVRPDLSPAQACKTLAHELGHVLLHGPHDISGERRERAEVEAESVAYVVCQAAGLVTDGYSFAYVAGWAHGDVSLIRDTADRVIGTARTILDRLAADTGALHDVTATAPERAK